MNTTSTTTILGAKLEIEGEVLTEEEVIVQGVLRGKLVSKRGISVEPGATVEANMEGSTFVIEGTVKGNVSSQGKVELGADAKVVGDVRATRIHIADGAHFRGSIDMIDPS